MFGYRPYGPRSDLRFIAGYHTDSSVLSYSQPELSKLTSESRLV
jgi:hypothetical protein